MSTFVFTFYNNETKNKIDNLWVFLLDVDMNILSVGTRTSTSNYMFSSKFQPDPNEDPTFEFEINKEYRIEIRDIVYTENEAGNPIPIYPPYIEQRSFYLDNFYVKIEGEHFKDSILPLLTNENGVPNQLDFYYNVYPNYSSIQRWTALKKIMEENKNVSYRYGANGPDIGSYGQKVYNSVCFPLLYSNKDREKHNYVGEVDDFSKQYEYILLPTNELLISYSYPFASVRFVYDDEIVYYEDTVCLRLLVNLDPYARIHPDYLGTFDYGLVFSNYSSFGSTGGSRIVFGHLVFNEETKKWTIEKTEQEEEWMSFFYPNPKEGSFAIQVGGAFRYFYKDGTWHGTDLIDTLYQTDRDGFKGFYIHLSTLTSKSGKQGDFAFFYDDLYYYDGGWIKSKNSNTSFQLKGENFKRYTNLMFTPVRGLKVENKNVFGDLYYHTGTYESKGLTPLGHVFFGSPSANIGDSRIIYDEQTGFVPNLLGQYLVYYDKEGMEKKVAIKGLYEVPLVYYRQDKVDDKGEKRKLLLESWDHLYLNDKKEPKTITNKFIVTNQGKYLLDEAFKKPLSSIVGTDGFVYFYRSAFDKTVIPDEEQYVSNYIIKYNPLTQKCKIIENVFSSKFKFIYGFLGPTGYLYFYSYHHVPGYMSEEDTTLELVEFNCDTDEFKTFSINVDAFYTPQDINDVYYSSYQTPPIKDSNCRITLASQSQIGKNDHLYIGGCIYSDYRGDNHGFLFILEFNLITHAQVKTIRPPLTIRTTFNWDIPKDDGTINPEPVNYEVGKITFLPVGHYGKYLNRAPKIGLLINGNLTFYGGKYIQMVSFDSYIANNVYPNLAIIEYNPDTDKYSMMDFQAPVSFDNVKIRMLPDGAFMAGPHNMIICDQRVLDLPIYPFLSNII